MGMSSSVQPAQPSPVYLRLSLVDRNTARTPRIHPPRRSPFIETFARYYEWLTDSSVALSSLGRRNLARNIWATYTEKQKVAWKDHVMDAAKRHEEIIPGYTFQAVTSDDMELERILGEEDAKRRLRKARERMERAAKASELKAQTKEESTGRRSASKHATRFAPYSRSSKPTQPSDGIPTGKTQRVPPASVQATGHSKRRAPRRVISEEEAALERMLRGLSLSAGDMK